MSPLSHRSISSLTTFSRGLLLIHLFQGWYKITINTYLVRFLWQSLRNLCLFLVAGRGMCTFISFLICWVHTGPLVWGGGSDNKADFSSLSGFSGELISQTSGFPLFQVEIRNDYCQISHCFVDLLAFTVVNLHLGQKWWGAETLRLFLLISNKLLIWSALAFWGFLFGFVLFNCYLGNFRHEYLYNQHGNFRKEICYLMASEFQECWWGVVKPTGSLCFEILCVFHRAAVSSWQSIFRRRNKYVLTLQVLFLNAWIYSEVWVVSFKF